MMTEMVMNVPSVSIHFNNVKYANKTLLTFMYTDNSSFILWWNTFFTKSRKPHSAELYKPDYCTYVKSKYSLSLSIVSNAST